MPMSSRFPGGATSDGPAFRKPRKPQIISGYGNYTSLMPISNFSGGGVRRQITTPGRLIPIGRHADSSNEPSSMDLWNEEMLTSDYAEALGEVVAGLADIGAITEHRAQKVIEDLNRAADPEACMRTLRGLRVGQASVGQLDMDSSMVQRALEILRLAYPKNKKYQKTVEDVARGYGVVMDQIDEEEPAYSASDRSSPGQLSARSDGAAVIGLDPGISVGFVPETAAGARIRTGGHRDAIDTDGYRTRL